MPSFRHPGRRLKVIHVISALPVGGAEILVYHLLRRLSRADFDAEVVCIRAEGIMAPAFRSAGIPVTLIKLPNRYSPTGIFRLAKHFARAGANVVHTHMRRPNTSARIAAWLARVPVVIAHEHNHGLDKNRKHLLIDRLQARFSSTVIAVSQSVAEDNARRGGAPIQRFTVMPNAVDLLEFRPGDGAAARHALGLSPDDHVVGFAGRLHPVKRIDVLLRAAALAAQEVPGLRLVLAGEGSERQSLEALASELGIAGRVVFLGPRLDMPSIYSAFDVLCLPSESEGCGMALMEAVASGIPTISTPVGCARDIAAAGGGMLVPIGDVRALAAALVRMANDPQTRTRMGQAARKLAAQHGLDTYVQRMEHLYLKFWEEHHGVRGNTGHSTEGDALT